MRSKHDLRRGKMLLAIAFGVLPISASAQVAFQPPSCEFRVIFVSTPDITNTTVNDDQGNPQTEAIAQLDPVLDGKPNYFRAECMIVSVPKLIDERALLDDMQTLANGNKLRKATAWIEKKSGGEMIGRVRGEFTDTVTTYVLDIRRYIGAHSVMDVWVGSPPDIFPSRGNLIFLKELTKDGAPLN
jgi:hypothetical protein